MSRPMFLMKNFDTLLDIFSTELFQQAHINNFKSFPIHSYVLYKCYPFLCAP